MATSQTTIDLEFGEYDYFTFSLGCCCPLKEFADQEVRMAFIPSMTGIDGKDFHCSRPLQFDSYFYSISFPDGGLSYSSSFLRSALRQKEEKMPLRTSFICLPDILIEFRAIRRRCQEELARKFEGGSKELNALLIKYFQLVGIKH
jgi:hypothetical protein